VTYFGPNIVFADATVSHIGFGVDAESLGQAFFVRRPHPAGDLRQPVRVIKYGAIVSLTVYLGLFLLPIWPVIQRIRQRKQETTAKCPNENDLPSTESMP